VVVDLTVLFAIVITRPSLAGRSELVRRRSTSTCKFGRVCGGVTAGANYMRVRGWCFNVSDALVSINCYERKTTELCIRQQNKTGQCIASDRRAEHDKAQIPLRRLSQNFPGRGIWAKGDVTGLSRTSHGRHGEVGIVEFGLNDTDQLREIMAVLSRRLGVATRRIARHRQSQ